MIVSIFDINVEKKKTNANKISSLNSIKTKENRTSLVISISFINKTIKNNNACNAKIREMHKENQINFQIINSYLFIGFDNIKNIVFPSISLNKSWLQTKSTLKNQKISIIASQKSTIILSSSQIVSFPKETEKTIKTSAKKTIRYKNLFLVISLNVFKAMFNILKYWLNYKITQELCL